MDMLFFFSSRRRHTRSVSAFLLNRSSDLSNLQSFFDSPEISESVNFCVMEAIKLCRLDTPIIFIEARLRLSRFVVTGCAAKKSAPVTSRSLDVIFLFPYCLNFCFNGVGSEAGFRKWKNVRSNVDGVRSIIQSRDGSLWVAAGSGMHRRKGDAWTDNGDPDGLRSDSASVVFEDKQGRVWAGTTRGLSRYYPDAD